MKLNIMILVGLCLVSCEEVSKKEYGLLQNEQSDKSISKEKFPLVISDGNYQILILEGKLNDKIAIMINPKSAPYYKQVPGDQNFSISRDFFYDLANKYKLNDCTYMCLQSHIEDNK